MDRPGSVGSSLKHMLECSVCLDNYNTADKIPKCLICGHTFCLLCIGKLDSFTYRTVKCPQCNKVCQIPPGGIGDFTTNYTNLDLLDQTCEICRCNQRSFLCAHCNLSLCDQCHLKHSEMFLVDTKSAAENLKTAKNRLQLVIDNDCNSAVETREIFNGVTEALKEYKKDLTKKSNDLREILIKSESFIEDFEANLLDQAEGDVHIKNINEQCMDLLNQLDTAEKALPLKAKWTFHVTVDHGGSETVIEKIGDIVLPAGSGIADRLKYGSVNVFRKLQSTLRRRLMSWATAIFIILHVVAASIMVVSMYAHVDGNDSSFLDHEVVSLSCGEELFIAHRAGVTSIDMESGEKYHVLSDTDVSSVTVGGNGFIYVGFSNQSTIEVYNTDHQYRRDIHLRADPDIAEGVLAIAIDVNDQLFVLRELWDSSGSKGYNIEFYWSDGTFIDTLYESDYDKTKYFGMPRFMEMLNSTSIVMTDTQGATKLLTFDNEHKEKIFFWFDFSPRPVVNAVVDSVGDILIADYWNSRLVVMENDGSRAGYLTGSQISGPSLLATCPNGDIFVVDYGNYFLNSFLYRMGFGLEPRARLFKIEKEFVED